MNFSTGISEYNANFNLNAINDYNRFLQGQASFEIEKDAPTFDSELEKATKSAILKDKQDPTGLGNFMNQIGNSFGNGLNAVNDAKLHAERLQEDLAMGGPTSIHEAMIAAEKSSLSLQMAIQVRNRILSAYTDITNMAL